MSPPYGWPIARRYCATAGFSDPPCGMAVTLSFGRREPPGLSQIMSFNSSLGTPLYPSKEVARGHSEVAVINLSDAR